MKKLDEILARLRNEETRWEALLEFKEYDEPDCIGNLIPLLKENDWLIRWVTAEKLGPLKDPIAIRPLLSLLTEEDRHISKAAMKSLEQIGLDVLPDAVFLFKHKNQLVRARVLELCERFGQKAIPVLSAQMEKKGWVISNRLIHTIHKIGGINAIDDLIRLLPHPYSQKTCIMALASFRSPVVVQDFIYYYQYPKLRQALLFGFKVIGKEKAFPLIIKALYSNNLYAQASTIILKIGRSILPFLVRSLYDPNLPPSQVVNHILKLGPGEYLPELIELSSTSPTLRQALAPFLKSQKSASKPLRKDQRAWFDFWKTSP